MRHFAASGTDADADQFRVVFWIIALDNRKPL
jgi:hypothetical protein